MSDESVCSVCSRLTGFGDEDKGEPPVNLARCPSPGGLECRAVAQAVAPLRRENEVLRSNSDHLSSENASLSRQVESMAMRIESLAEELAKPEDVRLREVLDALDGRAVIFDGLGARVGHLLDEMDEWIGRAGEAERLAEERLAHANQLQADINARCSVTVSAAELAHAQAILYADAKEPTFALELPLRLDSVANGGQGTTHGGRMVRAKATKTKREAVRDGLLLTMPEVARLLPARIAVRMVRIGPRELDSDNLARALKPCRDGVADALGTHDRDPRIDWLPAQEKRRGGYAVRIEVYT